MQSIISPLTILYFSLGLITFSGFGILFLNEETILAVCFFIFLFLGIQNSDVASQTLEEQKSAIRWELLSTLIRGQKNAVSAEILINHQEYELTLGLSNLFKDCDSKINKRLLI